MTYEFVAKIQTMGLFKWIKVNWKILPDYDNPDASHGLEEGNAVLSIVHYKLVN
jgi:hypothetical protein